MRLAAFVGLLCLTGAVTPLVAQKALTSKEVDQRVAAHAADFDYLLGDWEFVSHSKEWGPGKGRWSARKLDSGSIIDEYRILGDSGETWYITNTFRSYNAKTDQWDLVGTDHGTGLASMGHGRRVGNEFNIEQTFTNASGPSNQMRIHYYEISADSFRWEAALSKDGGKSWTPRHLTIEAKRIGPARPAEPMTPR